MCLPAHTTRRNKEKRRTHCCRSFHVALHTAVGRQPRRKKKLPPAPYRRVFVRARNNQQKSGGGQKKSLPRCGNRRDRCLAGAGGDERGTAGERRHKRLRYPRRQGARPDQYAAGKLHGVDAAVLCVAGVSSGLSIVRWDVEPVGARRSARGSRERHSKPREGIISLHVGTYILSMYIVFTGFSCCRCCFVVEGCC